MFKDNCFSSKDETSVSLLAVQRITFLKASSVPSCELEGLFKGPGCYCQFLMLTQQWFHHVLSSKGYRYECQMTSGLLQTQAGCIIYATLGRAVASVEVDRLVTQLGSIPIHLCQPPQLQRGSGATSLFQGALYLAARSFGCPAAARIFCNPTQPWITQAEMGNTQRIG